MTHEIKRCKETFDNWFRNSGWSKQYTKEEFLSEKSPLPYVYYKMCKSPEELKKEFGKCFKETCSSCGEQSDTWIETSFSFCDEYGCGMNLCPKCAEKLRDKINELLQINR
jgi:hypothetical protein